MRTFLRGLLAAGAATAAAVTLTSPSYAATVTGTIPVSAAIKSITVSVDAPGLIFNQFCKYSSGTPSGSALTIPNGTCLGNLPVTVSNSGTVPVSVLLAASDAAPLNNPPGTIGMAWTPTTADVPGTDQFQIKDGALPLTTTPQPDPNPYLGPPVAGVAEVFLLTAPSSTTNSTASSSTYTTTLTWTAV